MTSTETATIVLKKQQDLKNQTLDRWHGFSPSLRAACAEMILTIAQPKHCWQVLSEVLRTELDCDRVDAGPCNRYDLDYSPIAQANRPNILVPNVLGFSLPNQSREVQQLWYQTSPLISDAIENDSRFQPQLVSMLKSSGTKSLISFSIQQKGFDVGLVCLDQIESLRPWRSIGTANAYQFVTSIAAPILAASAAVTQACARAPSIVPMHLLSPRELEVAILASKAMSYKLIARKLGKSFSTVDHQLRSIRHKLGVKNQPELVRFLQSANVRD
jgi:DNA-binding CsgD family transcriptional regulator